MPRQSYIEVTRQLPTRNRGGRRPKEVEEQEYLSAEEQSKTDRRRERNREAAARCRQKRMDTISSLSQEADRLIKQQEKMEAEIAELKKERDELAFIIETHGKVCKFHPYDQASKIVSKLRPVEHQTKNVYVERPMSLDFINPEDTLNVHTGFTPGQTIFGYDQSFASMFGDDQ